MIWAGLASIIAPVIGRVLDKFADAEDPNLKLKIQALKAQLEAEVTMALSRDAAKLDQMAGQIVLAEVQGKSWLQRNWRPVMMWLLMFLIVWDLIIGPIFVAIGLPLKIDVPENVWTLLGIGMGGYVLGRSGEKIAKIWGQNRPSS